MVRDPHGPPTDRIRSVSRVLGILELVGMSRGGLNVKQIARRSGLLTATVYHLVRTLAYEGYLLRQEDGSYVAGRVVAGRYRELVAAGLLLRQATLETGYTHLLARLVRGQPTITAVVQGMRSPFVDEFISGFHHAARHGLGADAAGHSLSR